MKNFIIIFLSLSYFSNYAQQTTPKILVSVVVDQMKYEYVDRFWDEFGEKGIKKLVNEGIFCRNTHYNYIPTYTGLSKFEVDSLYRVVIFSLDI